MNQQAVEAGARALYQHFDGAEDGQIIWESPKEIQEEIAGYSEAAQIAEGTQP